MKSSSLRLELMQEAGAVIIASNLDEIERRYGPQGEDPQEYHHREHTQDVIDATIAIGALALERDKITEEDALLLPIAASGHDLVYNPFYKRYNEPLSAQRTISRMDAYDCFETRHKKRVGSLILATVVQEFYPRIIQSADPDDYATGILCDADLSSFGMPFEQFKPRAIDYLRELQRTNKQRLMQYWDFEMVILANHQWHTEEAATLYPHAHANIEAVRSLQTTYAAQ